MTCSDVVSLNQIEWVSPHTGVDDGGGINGYKKRTRENIVSLTKTFDLEGCLAVKILSQVKMKHQCTNVHVLLYLTFYKL